MNSENICLTTLAIGSKYRKFAQLLAQDLINLAVDNPLIILTDQPQDFTKFKNVIPMQHTIRSVSVYHDKRFCFEESLKLFECCIFLDADCRLFSNVVESRDWKNGITAKSCKSLLKHINHQQIHLKEIKLKLLSTIAQKYSISNLEDCKFIHESFFVGKKDGLKHEKFLDTWNDIRILYEGNKIYAGEGEVMGLAAHICDFKIFHYDTDYPEVQDRHQIDDVYKDIYFKTRKNIDKIILEKVTKFEKERIRIEKKYDFWKKTYNSLSKKLFYSNINKGLNP